MKNQAQKSFNALSFGFTLIEILLATAIAAMVASALFFSFGVINDYVVVIDDYADETVKESTLHAQMEKDLLGAFTPVAALATDQKSTSTVQSPSEPKAKQETKEKKEKKKLSKVFYGTAKEGNMDILTFITSNSLQIYWSKKVGRAKPRIARVVYRLVPEKTEKGVFTLMRQEGTELDYDAYKPGGTKAIRDYAMVEGIKQLSVEYMQEDTKEKSDKQGAKKTYKTTKEWKPEGGAKKEKSLLPDGVILKGALWDKQRRRDTSFEFKIMINANAQSPEESKPLEQQMAAQPQAGKQEQKKGPIDAQKIIDRFQSEDLKKLFSQPKIGYSPVPVVGPGQEQGLVTIIQGNQVPGQFH